LSQKKKSVLSAEACRRFICDAFSFLQLMLHNEFQF
jgi:hypothetical protein